jgi:hypothetical protein
MMGIEYVMLGLVIGLAFFLTVILVTT